MATIQCFSLHFDPRGLRGMRNRTVSVVTSRRANVVIYSLAGLIVPFVDTTLIDLLLLVGALT